MKPVLRILALLALAPVPHLAAAVQASIDPLQVFLTIAEKGFDTSYHSTTHKRDNESWKEYLTTDDVKKDARNNAYGASFAYDGIPINASAKDSDFAELKKHLEHKTEQDIQRDFFQEIYSFDKSTPFAALYFKALTDYLNSLAHSQRTGVVVTDDTEGDSIVDFEVDSIPPVGVTKVSPLITSDLMVQQGKLVSRPLKRGTTLGQVNRVVFLPDAKGDVHAVLGTEWGDVSLVHIKPASTPTPTPNLVNIEEQQTKTLAGEYWWAGQIGRIEITDLASRTVRVTMPHNTPTNLSWDKWGISGATFEGCYYRQGYIYPPPGIKPAFDPAIVEWDWQGHPVIYFDQNQWWIWKGDLP